MSTRVAHIITGLGNGGAEHMLERLVGALSGDDYAQSVICLTGDTPIAARLRARGCPTRALGCTSVMSSVPAAFGLYRTLRDFAPDLVQTWLCHADLIGGLVAHYTLGVPVVWGVHQAEAEIATTPWTTRVVKALCSRLSHRVPCRIVSVSRAGRDVLVAAGFPANAIVVIPNGIDTAVFEPRPMARAALCAELGLAADTILVGLAARWHPDKDHATFLAAASRIRKTCPSARFVLVGEGITATNAALGGLLAATGTLDVCHLLGFRTDLAAILAGLDVAVLSSRTEAMPNVVLEAMATGVPVVATAVGDVAWMLDDTGTCVPRQDPAALAAAIGDFCTVDAATRRARGAAARARVVDCFSLASCAARYRALYTDILGRADA